MKLLTTDTFEETISSSSGTVLAYFSAVWCRPCVMVSPLMEKLDERDDVTVYKVDADASRDLVMSKGIMGIPTVIKYVDGKQVDSTKGAQSEAVYTQFAIG